MQRTPEGRFLRGLELLSPQAIVKTAIVDGPFGDAPGRIDRALFRTNITTRLRGAKRFEIRIRGRDHRDKEHRLRISVDYEGPSDKAYPFMIMRIVEALRRRGFRTQYRIEEARFTHAEMTGQQILALRALSKRLRKAKGKERTMIARRMAGIRAQVWTPARARKLQQLHNVEITVQVMK
jgi:hypothetical protein